MQDWRSSEVTLSRNSFIVSSIKAWLGTYQIHGKPELISLAYDTGLGSKNSQGFGMFEILLKKVK